MKILKKIKDAFSPKEEPQSSDPVGLVKYKGKYYRVFDRNYKGVYLENTKTRRKIHVKNIDKPLIINV